MRAQTPIRFLLVLAAMAVSLVASTQQNVDQRAFQAQYDRIAQALVREDLKTIVDMMTSNFKLTRQNGQVMTRKEIETNYRQQFQMVKSWPKADLRVRSVRSVGQKVEVVAVSNVVAVLSIPQMDAKNQPVMKDGKMQMRDGRFEINSESRDVWVRSGSSWRVESIKVVKETTKLDGKAIDMSGRG